MFKQLTSAITYLHNFNVCHGDIKPENVMLKNAGDLTSIKLIDFGFSRKVRFGESLTIPFGTVGNSDTADILRAGDPDAELRRAHR